ncbi:MAG: ribbon-helix-helix domain-containing protein [Rhodomicrobium sp.]
MPGGRGGDEDAILDLAFDPKLAVPKKRSLTIAGHRTSITLEDAFWHELRAVAECSGVSVTALTAAIDSMRGAAGLSAAIRVFLLTRLRELPSNASE